MRKIFWLPLLTAVCCLTSLHADLTIVQHVDGMGQNMDTTMMFKAGRTRVDASPQTSMIMDLKSGEMISLMHAQKSYMKIPSQMAQMAMDAMKQSSGTAKSGMALTPTGKKDTISGYPAEEYTATIAGMKMTMWLTKAVPDYANLLKQMSDAFAQGPMAVMMKGIGLDMAALPGFPVRTVNELQPGQTVTSTVLSVSSKPIPDSEFDVPADYKQMTMPNFGPPTQPAAPDSGKPASQ
jgi:hypothetical protein